MKTEKLSLEAALSCAAALPYAWIRCLSTVTLGRNPGIPDLEELTEARYFDRDRELRIFRGEDGLRAVLLTGEPEDHVLEQIHTTETPARFGKSLTLCRVLDFDEDGQAFVKAVRLCDWKEADSHE